MGESPEIVPLGLDALLVRFASRLDEEANRACIAFRASLEDEPIPGVVETAPSLASVLVRLDGAADEEEVGARLRERLAARDWTRAPEPERRLWHIPTSYGGEDGPQLGEVARAAGMGEAEAVEVLSQARLRVLALGFAPGMPYLGILPPEWDVPRLSGLTPRVPEGALVLAVRQFVLFGTEAPTGWRQVGRTMFGCCRPDRRRPIALAAGDVVTFPSVNPDGLRTAADADPEGHGGARWEPLK
jgi:KipI family sensor histidine kinase inhibitor